MSTFSILIATRGSAWRFKGSYKWGLWGSFKGSFKGLYRVSRISGLGVVISGVISPLTWVIIIVALLITPLITSHEPPRGMSVNPESPIALN